jgi:capsid protein
VEQGTIFWGEPGETVSGVPRNLPGSQFPESVRTFLRLVGAPFGLPLSLLLLDYSQTNYSSSRAELEQASRIHARRQRDLKRQHHNPITRWWIEWQVLDGLLPMPPEGVRFWDFYGFEWIAPSFPWIDQQKEAEAWGTRFDRGLATQTEALASLGVDYEEHLNQRSREILKARHMAQEINKATPEQPSMDWRSLAGFQYFVGDSAAVADVEGEVAKHEASGDIAVEKAKQEAEEPGE